MRRSRASLVLFGWFLVGSAPFANVAFAQQRGVQNGKGKSNVVSKTENAHAHPTHGPHEGELIEIGNEEYHLEVVVAETEKMMTVFLLDKEGKDPVAIESEFLMVNVKLNGKPQQIKLPAKPLAEDPEKRSSSFGVQSDELFNALHDSKADPKISLKIGAKSYVVKLEHHHDHDHAAAASKNRPINAGRTNGVAPRRR